MSKGRWITIIVLGLAVLAGLSWWFFRVVNTSSVNNFADLIQVGAPQSNALVTSPLVVTGRARGPWYFEASFPVRLFDANGRELAVTPAQAQGEWMTENFVPFRATLTFSPPATLTGTLVLHNDNPSGLPENDKEIRIPVRFRR